MTLLPMIDRGKVIAPLIEEAGRYVRFNVVNIVTDGRTGASKDTTLGLGHSSFPSCRLGV